MVTDATIISPAKDDTNTVEFVLPVDASVQVIEGLLEALRPIRHAHPANRVAWETLVESLEDADDIASLKEWEANGGLQEESIPLSEVIKELGLDEEKLRRGL